MSSDSPPPPSGTPAVPVCETCGGMRYVRCEGGGTRPCPACSPEPKRLDSEGRDVTDLPGLWSEEDALIEAPQLKREVERLQSFERGWNQIEAALGRNKLAQAQVDLTHYVPRLKRERDEARAEAERLREEVKQVRSDLLREGMERDEARAALEAAKADYVRACETIASMHAAAVGEVTGPKRGVVEDVQDALADRAPELEAALREAEQALDKLWAAIGDALCSGVGIAQGYAQKVQSEVLAARKRATEALR